MVGAMPTALRGHGLNPTGMPTQSRGHGTRSLPTILERKVYYKIPLSFLPGILVLLRQFAEPFFQETSLWSLLDQGQRPLVRLLGFRIPAKPTLEVGSHGVGEVIVIQFRPMEELIDQAKPRLDPIL